jgi:hypothetical protein
MCSVQGVPTTLVFAQFLHTLNVIEEGFKRLRPQARRVSAKHLPDPTGTPKTKQTQAGSQYSC